MGYAVTCAGVDITQYVEDKTMIVKSSINQVRGATLEFEVRGTGVALLKPWGEIAVTDFTNTKVFGGYLTMLDDASFALTPRQKVSCQDYTQRLLTRVVIAVYVEQGDVAVLKNLLNTYFPWVDTSQLPASTAIIPRIQFNRLDVLACVTRICSLSNYVFWIDPNKVAHYADVNSAQVAPFGISDSPDNVTTFGAHFTQHSWDYTSLTNRVYFYGGTTRSLDNVEDVSSQASGSMATFSLAYPPLPSSVVMPYTNPVSGYTYGKRAIVVTVNGNQYAAGQENYDNLIGVNNGTCVVVANRDEKHIRFAQGNIPAKGSTVTVTYQYDVPIILSAQDSQSYAAFGDWFDGRVSDQRMVDLSAAQLRATTIIEQEGFGKQTGTLSIYKPGLVAGQAINIVNGVRGISGQFLIQTVTGNNKGAGVFEYDVEYGAYNKTLQDHLTALNTLVGPEDTYNANDITNQSSSQSALVLFPDAHVQPTLTDSLYALTQSTSHGYYPGTAPAYPGFSCPGSF